MSGINDYEIFSGKTFGDLYKDIYTNSKHKRNQIDLLIDELRRLITTTQDAVTIVPMIRDYLDVGVRNDEHLVKLAAVVQRVVAKSNGDNDASVNSILTDEEKAELLKSVKETAEQITKPEK